MHSFLSKVFPRKKEEKEARTNKRNSAASLLEGKFEAVHPPDSPSATQITDTSQRPSTKEKEREKEHTFTLFRPKSRSVSPLPDARVSNDASVPHLTLNLPVPKERETRALGVVFEADPDDVGFISEKLIGERRLNPLEALLLVKACSSAIVQRGGLETLGVMHPRWYSASPDAQRRLISLFILSLAPKSPITTLSPTPTSPSMIFNAELEGTRSPHDIAAVLRWGLRHLRLDGNTFGSSNATSGSTDEWQWYATFAEAERSGNYPSTAFSSLLVPRLPPAHLQLLATTLDIVSSLAAHSERNGISGSKLSKFLGLWLLAARSADEDDDWPAFYARWEHAGRILEHLFLAQIRDEMVRKTMPLRLAELVASYPYNKGGNVPEDGLLPHPRLSTRQYDALHVRVETQLPDFKTAKPKARHPLRIIADAMKAEVQTNGSSYDAVWDAIKQVAADSQEGATEGDEDPTTAVIEAEGFPSLSRLFADETIRLLSLIPANNASDPITPTVQLTSPSGRMSRPTEPRSLSRTNGSPPVTNGSTSQSSPGTASTSKPKDWIDFSTTGFGESTIGNDFAKTLLDSDIEVTTPRTSPSLSHKASKRRKPTTLSDRDGTSTAAARGSPKALKSKIAKVNMTLLDEAFIDFWSDALLDPISGDWPSFVLCQLKEAQGASTSKPIYWLVLEQVFTRPPPPAEPQPMPPPQSARASSPRPSIRSNISARKSATFAGGRKRFTFFSSSRDSIVSSLDSKTAGAKRKAGQTPIVGEMGEILKEEPEEPLKGEYPVKKEKKAEERPTGLGLEGVAVGALAPTEPVPVKADLPEIKTADLPPVPVVDAEPASSPEAPPTATEPLKVDEGFTEKPIAAIPGDVVSPANALEKSAAAEEKSLPPAPDPVVLAGETPGPEVALSTSEPVALAEASAVVPEAQVAEPVVEEEPAAPEPAVQEPIVQEPAAHVALEEHVAQEPVFVEEATEDETAVPQTNWKEPSYTHDTIPVEPKAEAIQLDNEAKASDAVQSDAHVDHEENAEGAAEPETTSELKPNVPEQEIQSTSAPAAESPDVISQEAEPVVQSEAEPRVNVDSPHNGPEVGQAQVTADATLVPEPTTSTTEEASS